MPSARLSLSLLLPAAVISLAGCGGGGKALVTQFPRWEYERYQRIAVLPGRATNPQAVGDAAILADRLTTLLTQNGTFTVLSRADMKDVIAEQDLSLIEGAIDAGTALPVGKIQVAQALVATRITDYNLISRREQQRTPIYARDRRGRVIVDRAGRPVIAGEEVVWIYYTGAEVEGSVRVIDAATGHVLVSHSARIAPRPRTSRNQPPRQSAQDMAAAAAAELAMEFYKVIAPTRTEVELDQDMLAVATGYFDGRYETPKKLPRSASEFMLVVRDLPEECDRNNFRVAIAAQDGRENLWEEEFVWTGTAGPEGLTFTIPMTTLAAAGAEKFEAKLYSGRDPEPILRRGFSLAKPE